MRCLGSQKLNMCYTMSIYSDQINRYLKFMTPAKLDTLPEKLKLTCNLVCIICLGKPRQWSYRGRWNALILLAFHQILPWNISLGTGHTVQVLEHFRWTNWRLNSAKSKKFHNFVYGPNKIIRILSSIESIELYIKSIELQGNDIWFR